MNKSKLKIFIIIAILLLLIAIIFLFVTKNQKQSNVQLNNKEALNFDEFKNRMQEYGYMVVGPISYDETYTECTAYDQSNSIEIRLFKYSSEDESKDIFDIVKSVGKKNNTKFEIDLSDKFTAIEGNNRFAIVSMAGDTILISNVDIKYKEIVTDIFNNLGY